MASDPPPPPGQVTAPIRAWRDLCNRCPDDTVDSFISSSKLPLFHLGWKPEGIGFLCDRIVRSWKAHGCRSVCFLPADVAVTG